MIKRTRSFYVGQNGPALENAITPNIYNLQNAKIEEIEKYLDKEFNKKSKEDFKTLEFKIAPSFANNEDQPMETQTYKDFKHTNNVGSYIFKRLFLLFLIIGIIFMTNNIIMPEIISEKNLITNGEQLNMTASLVHALHNIMSLFTIAISTIYALFTIFSIISVIINPSSIATTEEIIKTKQVPIKEDGRKDFNFFNTIYYDKTSNKLKRGYEFIDFEESSIDKVILKIPNQFKEIKENTEDFDIYDQFCLSKQSDENLREIFNSILENKDLKKTTEYLSLADELRKANEFKNIAKDIENENIEKRLSEKIKNFK